eukprot:TRINITY_DN1428_c0_g1_i3.p1 TRINITY_DN1428_c0_g1~~TRINITY_DN1428_c0_g1_i3.p1  ORF type:complete len:839 (+),score=170.49 TRINITY_DN1428_c0_g1_i3:16-2532(+)
MLQKQWYQRRVRGVPIVWREQIMTNYFGEAYSEASLSDPEQFWSWLNSTLLPGLLSSIEDELSYTHSFQQMVSDSILLRQFRTLPNKNCILAQSQLDNYSSYVTDCLTSTLQEIDTSVWQGVPYVNDGGTPLLQSLLSRSGYPAGGHVVKLGLNHSLQSAFEVLNSLAESGWYDAATKALIVEFMLYSANLRMFSVVSAVIEVTSTGSHVERVGMYFLSEEVTDNWTYWIYVCIFFTVCGFLTEEILEWFARYWSTTLGEELKDFQRLLWSNEDNIDLYIRSKSSKRCKKENIFFESVIDYMKDQWNYLDLAYLSMLLMHAYLMLTINWFFPLLDPFNVTFQDLIERQHWLQFAKIFGAIASIIVWTRTTYFLSIFKLIGPILVAIFDMAWDVLYFLVLLITILFGFSAALELTYGGYTDHTKYAGFLPSFFSSVRCAFSGDWELLHGYKDILPFMFSFHLVWGDILVTSYMILSNRILVNVLVTLMSATFERVQENANQKWELLRNSQLLFYKQLPIAPPPLNLLHLFYIPIAKFGIFVGHLPEYLRIFGTWYMKILSKKEFNQKQYVAELAKHALADCHSRTLLVPFSPRLRSVWLFDTRNVMVDNAAFNTYLRLMERIYPDPLHGIQIDETIIKCCKKCVDETTDGLVLVDGTGKKQMSFKDLVILSPETGPYRGHLITYLEPTPQLSRDLNDSEQEDDDLNGGGGKDLQQGGDKDLQGGDSLKQGVEDDTDLELESNGDLEPNVWLPPEAIVYKSSMDCTQLWNGLSLYRAYLYNQLEKKLSDTMKLVQKEFIEENPKWGNLDKQKQNKEIDKFRSVIKRWKSVCVNKSSMNEN